MSNIQKAIVGIASAAFIALSVMTFIKVLLPHAQPTVASGTTTFNVVQGIPYTVSLTVEPTDNTVTISSFNSPGGSPFTMKNFGTLGYATLDPTNLSRLETISFTGITNNGSSVTLTGVTRGIDFVSPYTASTTLERIHLVGSSLILSNPAAFYGQQFALLNSTSTIGANWVFGSTTPPAYDFNPNFLTVPTTTLASIGYVQATYAAGCAAAGVSNGGCVILATAKQAASTTASNLGFNDVLWAGYATDTPSAVCSNGFGGCSVMSLLNGKINQLWLDLTQAFTVTGAWIFNSTATFNGQTNVAATSTATAKTIGYNQELNMTASTTITGFTLPQPVFIATSTGAMILSSANTYGASNFTGFAITNAVNGGTVVVQTGGVVSGFSGLTPGADYYVQNSAGTIGTSIPVPEIYVGTAISATQILIQTRDMQYLGTGSVNGNSTTTVPAFTRTILVSMGVGTGLVGNNSGGTLGLNAGASNPSVSVAASTCCSAVQTNYSVTWNTSGIYAGTAVGGLSGNGTNSGSATLWFYR